MLRSYYTEFFTATILNWQKLLHDDNLKQIIVDSFRAAVGVPANSSFKPQMSPIIYLHT